MYDLENQQMKLILFDEKQNTFYNKTIKDHFTLTPGWHHIIAVWHSELHSGSKFAPH